MRVLCCLLKHGSVVEQVLQRVDRLRNCFALARSLLLPQNEKAHKRLMDMAPAVAGVNGEGGAAHYLHYRNLGN